MDEKTGKKYACEEEIKDFAAAMGMQDPRLIAGKEDTPASILQFIIEKATLPTDRLVEISITIGDKHSSLTLNEEVGRERDDPTPPLPLKPAPPQPRPLGPPGASPTGGMQAMIRKNAGPDAKK